MYYYPFVFGIIAFFSTMAGGLYVLKHPNHLGAVSALASGVLIALSLFDLLPQTLSLASSTRLTIESIMYIVAAGFLVLLVVQRYFSVKHVTGHGGSHNIKSSRGGWFGTASLMVHSFVEGAAIGAGFHLNFHVGLLVALTIIAHDFCDGINAVTIMKNSKNSGRSSVVMLMAVALAPLLGVASTLFVTIPDKYLILIIAFLVGAFLYLGAVDCLPEALERNKPKVTMWFFVSGFLIIFLVTRISG